MRFNAHDISSRLHSVDLVHQALSIFTRRAGGSATSRLERFYVTIVPHAPFVLRTAQTLLGSAKHHGAEAHHLALDTLVEAHRTLDQLAVATQQTDGRRFLASIMRRLRLERARPGVKRTGAADGALNLNVLREELQNMSVDGAVNPAVTFADPWDDVEDPNALLDQFTDSAIVDAMHRLPEELRWPMVLVDVEGFSLDEAASVMRVTSAAIESRLKRGRAGLRDLLYPTYD